MEDILFVGQDDSVAPSFSEIEQIRYMSADDGSLYYCGDLFYLFNMERIASVMGEDVAFAILKRMAANASSPRSDIDMSDAERMEYMKSRFIQSPTEVQAWYTSLQARLSEMKSRLDDLNTQIKEQEIAAALEKQQSESVEKND